MMYMARVQSLFWASLRTYVPRLGIVSWHVHCGGTRQVPKMKWSANHVGGTRIRGQTPSVMHSRIGTVAKQVFCLTVCCFLFDFAYSLLRHMHTLL